jgi:hypothetical protein
VIAQTGNAQNNAQALPSHFINNRIFVEPVTTQGDTLKLYTDSGGGQILSQDLVNRIHLPTEEIHPGSRTMKVVALPDFIPQADIPAPANQAVSVDAASLHHKYNIMQGRLFVKSQMPNGFGEGMLGRNWFGTRIWTFDYPSHKLLLRSSYTPPESPANHRVPIYFKENNQGKHLMHFPRITAVIGQDTLSFLFDTGATIQLNDHTEAQYVAGLKEISGGSFIIRSRFEQWHKEHPDWKIVEDAALHGADLIRVPQVTIAGYTVGPVWFATRPDRNFEQKMAQWMDRKVQGAVGGSLFQYFRITLNYPEGYAVFDQEEGS